MSPSAPRGASPLFIDTGAFYARFKPDDENHGAAVTVFNSIQSGDLPYRPLYTSRYVLAELSSLLLYNVGHADADRVLTTIRESESFNILPVDDAVYSTACDKFARYDDQEISLIDQLGGVLARNRDIDRIFAFDSDFRTLGFTVVPADTGEA
jgi:predicted nucleic acid-binding protein